MVRHAGLWQGTTSVRANPVAARAAPRRPLAPSIINATAVAPLQLAASARQLPACISAQQRRRRRRFRRHRYQHRCQRLPRPLQVALLAWSQTHQLLVGAKTAHLGLTPRTARRAKIVHVNLVRTVLPRVLYTARTATATPAPLASTARVAAPSARRATPHAPPANSSRVTAR